MIVANFLQMFKLYIKDSFSLIKGDGFNQIEKV